MKIEIFGKDYNVSDSLKAITEKKCAKLDRYFGDDENATVKFIVTLEGDTYTTDMTLHHGHDGRLSQSDLQGGGIVRLPV